VFADGFFLCHARFLFSSSFLFSMRRLLLLSLVIGLGMALPALGQDGDASSDETLIRGIEQNGGYGAPTVSVTSFNGEAAIMTGGQGGWIINRQFIIGAGGRGLATRHGSTLNGQSVDLEMGYGGLLLEYVSAPSRLVHLGGELLIGGGGAAFVRDRDLGGYVDEYDKNTLEHTSFFATEAGIRGELNVTSFFRFGLSGGYRLIVGSTLPGISDRDLGGPYGRLSLRFGSF
jgi:hypothetical protein